MDYYILSLWVSWNLITYYYVLIERYMYYIN